MLMLELIQNNDSFNVPIIYEYYVDIIKFV